MTSDLTELTRTREVRFWGETYTVTPELIDEVWGDGALLLFITPLNSRPSYYLARVDSSAADLSESDIDDLFDEVIDHIEGEYGVAWPDCKRQDEEDEDDRDYCHDTHIWCELSKQCHAPWPALDIGSGWVGDIMGPVDEEVAKERAQRLAEEALAS